MKPDRRSQRTKDNLQLALLTLLQNDPYPQLTIQNITDQANVGRATFYRYYGHKDELLVDCLKKIFSEGQRRSTPLSIAGIESGEQESPLLPLYREAENNFNLFQAIFTDHAAPLSTRVMRGFIADYVRQQLETLLPANTSPFPHDLIAGHVSAAVVGAFVWWLENDRPYPAGYMSEASMWLSLFGTLGIANSDIVPPNLPPIE